MSEIQTSIINRVKKELQISEDVNPFDLYNHLIKARNRSHPDKFSDDNSEKAKERFQLLNTLLEELKSHIETIKLEKPENELAIYEKSIESVFDKSKIIELEKEIEDLNDQLNYKGRKVEKLEKEIEKFQENKTETLTSELLEIYKPNKSNIIVLGISALLILIVNVLSQIQEIQNGISRIIPVELKYMNYILFGLLLLIVVKILIKNWKSKKVQIASEELKSNSVIREFSNRYTKEKDDYFETKYFIESDLERFIYNNYSKGNFYSPGFYNYKSKYDIRYLIQKLIFNLRGLLKITDKKSLNYLRDIFIYNLLSKGFIKSGKTKNLDREFLLK